MNYHFVYDPNVFTNVLWDLSKEEVKIVLATVIGQHNALFFGYKPERLVKAVKKLCKRNFIVVNPNSTRGSLLRGSKENYLEYAEGGILYIENVDNFESDFQMDIYVASENAHRTFQLVTTTKNEPTVNVVENLLDNFDIVYECKPSEKQEFSYSVLKYKIVMINNYREGLKSGNFITGLFPVIDEYWLTRSGYSLYKKLEAKDKSYAMKIAKVARSLSDIKSNNMTEVEEIEEAQQLYCLKNVG